MFLASFFKWVVGELGKGLKLAHLSGLDDQLVKLALVWVRVAADKFVESPEKRAFVIDILVKTGVSEPIARIAVELAYVIYKKEFKEPHDSQ